MFRLSCAVVNVLRGVQLLKPVSEAQTGALHRIRQKAAVRPEAVQRRLEDIHRFAMPLSAGA